MEPYDYKVWLAMQKELEAEKNKEGIIDTSVLTTEEQEIEDQLFEAVSKRAWTDVLLQILKVSSLTVLTTCPHSYRCRLSHYFIKKNSAVTRKFF